MSRVHSVRSRILCLIVVLQGFVLACEPDDYGNDFPEPRLTATSEASAIWKQGPGSTGWVEVRNVDPNTTTADDQQHLPTPDGIDRLAVSRTHVAWIDSFSGFGRPRRLRVFAIADVGTRLEEVPAWAPWGPDPVDVVEFSLAGTWLAWVEAADADGFNRVGLANLAEPGAAPIDLGRTETRSTELASTETLVVWRDGDAIMALAAPFDASSPSVIGDVSTAPEWAAVALHAAGRIAAWAHDDEVYVFDASLPWTASSNPRRLAGGLVHHVTDQAVLYSRAGGAGLLWDASNPDERPRRAGSVGGTFTRMPAKIVGNHVVWAECTNLTERTIFNRERRCVAGDPDVRVYASPIRGDLRTITLQRDLKNASELSGGPFGAVWISGYGDEEVITYWNPGFELADGVNPLAVEGGRTLRVGAQLVEEGLVFHGRNHDLHWLEAAWLLVASDPSR